jgi:16S rRNA (cytidine1402-2'-O)-methyltransferase
MVVLYEAPHRLTKLMEELKKRCPERPAALCKDLTKRFESVQRGSVATLADSLASREILGEYVLVLGPWEGGQDPEQQKIDPRQLLLEQIDAGMDKKEAIRQVSRLCNLPRREIYQISLDISDEDE